MHKSIVLLIGLTGAKSKFPSDIPCMANTKSNFMAACSLVSLTMLLTRYPLALCSAEATCLFPRCISIHGELWAVLLANSSLFDMVLWKSVDFTLSCYLGPMQMEYFFLFAFFLQVLFDLNMLWFVVLFTEIAFLLCKAEFWKLCRCPTSSNCFMIWV